MGYYLALQKNPAVGDNKNESGGLMLGETNQSRKDKYCQIPRTGGI